MLVVDPDIRVSGGYVVTSIAYSELCACCLESLCHRYYILHIVSKSYVVCNNYANVAYSFLLT